MPHRSYHVFLSYSRKDNLPKNPGGEGWVTAFKRELEARHGAYSGRQLEICLDHDAIDAGDIWKRRLGEALRSSRLFLAFLSPNYITSRNCLWEWEEYLRHEHSAARGDDGITPIYFVTPRELTAGDDQRLAAWLADLRRRNRTVACELHPWFARGPEILRELDAAGRSAEIRDTPRDPAADVRTLSERLDALDRRIAARLDRIALADLAPGNVVRSHEHFVGRHRELSDLHEIMLTGGPQSGGRGMGGRGMIAAAHSPGGLGKTALARQYAHAYAEFYAAGGTWEIGCEGVATLGGALLKLADDPRLHTAGRDVIAPLALGDAQRADPDLAAAAVLDFLGRLTHARAARLREELKRHPERHSREPDLPVIAQPRCLLILDNVDRAELLAASQIALLPAVEWLEVIVTTRCDPADFGAGERWQQPVEIHPLPEADALELLRDFQPGHRFTDVAEEEAARGIARALGGYTLAVELVGAYLGAHAREGYAPSAFLRRLEEAGLTEVDRLGDESQTEDQSLRAQHPWLRDHLAHLIGRWPTPSLLQSAGVAATFEGEHGSLIRALELMRRVLDEEERILAANPQSPQAARDVSVLVGMQADFLARRGKAGDAEQALGYYERSLKVCEELLAANPQSVKAARGVSVSLEKLADFLASRGKAGDAEQALFYYERDLKISEELLAANPQSVACARDVVASHQRLGLFFQKAEQQELAVAHLGECHRILHALHKAGCNFDPQMTAAYEQLRAQLGAAPDRPPPPSRELSATELRATAEHSFSLGHWEAAETGFQKLLAQGAPVAEIVPKLIACLLNTNPQLPPAIVQRVEELLTLLEAAGGHDIAAEIRRRMEQMRPPPPKKPWWKFW